MMVTLGTDAQGQADAAHVKGHGAGSEMGSVTVAATTDGHLRAVQWAAQFKERGWEIEECPLMDLRPDAPNAATSQMSFPTLADRCTYLRVHASRVLLHTQAARCDPRYLRSDFRIWTSYVVQPDGSTPDVRDRKKGNEIAREVLQ